MIFRDDVGTEFVLGDSFIRGVDPVSWLDVFVCEHENSHLQFRRVVDCIPEESAHLLGVKEIFELCVQEDLFEELRCLERFKLRGLRMFNDLEGVAVWLGPPPLAAFLLRHRMKGYKGEVTLRKIVMMQMAGARSLNSRGYLGNHQIHSPGPLAGAHVTHLTYAICQISAKMRLYRFTIFRRGLYFLFRCI